MGQAEGMLSMLTCVQMIELVAEEVAPKLGYRELLQQHPSDTAEPADEPSEQEEPEEPEQQPVSASSQASFCAADESMLWSCGLVLLVLS